MSCILNFVVMHFFRDWLFLVKLPTSCHPLDFSSRIEGQRETRTGLTCSFFERCAFFRLVLKDVLK